MSGEPTAGRGSGAGRQIDLRANRQRVECLEERRQFVGAHAQRVRAAQRRRERMRAKVRRARECAACIHDAVRVKHLDFSERKLIAIAAQNAAHAELVRSRACDAHQQ
jgi:hypothetical protein